MDNKDIAASFTFILHILIRDIEAKFGFDRQGFADELKRQVEEVPPSASGMKELVEKFATNILLLKDRPRPLLSLVQKDPDNS